MQFIYCSQQIPSFSFFGGRTDLAIPSLSHKNELKEKIRKNTCTFLVGALRTRKLLVAAESLDITGFGNDTGDCSRRFYVYVMKITSHING